jgi:mannitol/fructose-specific phosphotransferase system IIA component (Ntr-type)
LWNTNGCERAPYSLPKDPDGRKCGSGVRPVARRAVTRGMRAVEIIATGGIMLAPPCGTFEQAVGGLVDTLIANNRLPDAMRHEAVRAVCDREAMASTAVVEIGVSVPHARLSGIAGVIGALAATPTALYYATAGVPISIMVLIFSAPDLIGEHLNTLASISLLLQSAALRRDIEHAPDSATALRILRGPNGGGL